MSVRGKTITEISESLAVAKEHQSLAHFQHLERIRTFFSLPNFCLRHARKVTIFTLAQSRTLAESSRCISVFDGLLQFARLTNALKLLTY